jgi:hypothetical protein
MAATCSAIVTSPARTAKAAAPAERALHGGRHPAHDRPSFMFSRQVRCARRTMIVSSSRATARRVASVFSGHSRSQPLASSWSCRIYGPPRRPGPGHAGGSNGYRTRDWKAKLAALAIATGLEITVCHFPPGTSKWNKVEHRLFLPHHDELAWQAAGQLSRPGEPCDVPVGSVNT